MPSVLIVDDEPNIRRMVGALLGAEGYEVSDAQDGMTGLQRAIENEPDPRFWIAAIGRLYVQLQRSGDRIMLSDLWIQALNQASEDPKIRKYLRDQVREVHDYVADVIRRSQAAGGILKDRDPDAEAWMFMSLGLLSTMDRRLGIVGDEAFEGVFASRRAWMLGV